MTTSARQHPLRREDARLLRGRARFVNNIDLPGTTHGAFVRSPFAHAEIGGIDPARALAAGALAVLTGRDLPFNDQRWIVRYWHPSIRNGLPKFLAADQVRFVGEPVAFVVAVDRYRAEDLAQLVDVEYRPMPAVADIESARAEGATLLHPQKCRRRVQAPQGRCLACVANFRPSHPPALSVRSTSSRPP